MNLQQKSSATFTIIPNCWELENIDIVCDDEGLLDNAPEVNVLASLLYGAAVHGQPIVGNVIISAHDAAGNDIGLTNQQIQKIACFLAR